MHVHTYTRGGGVLASSISFGITIVRWPIPRRIYKPESGLIVSGEKKRKERRKTNEIGS